MQETIKPRPILAYLAVLVALAAPLIQIALRPLWELMTFPVDRFFSLSVFWIAAAFALFVSVRLEGFPLRTFGISRPLDIPKNPNPLRFRLIELIAALIAGLLIAIILIPFSLTMRDILNMPLDTTIDLNNVLPFWVTLPAWITAAFFEELLFRAYAIERLSLLTGKRWLAVVISIVCFAFFHIFAWDWLHLLTLGIPATLIITGLYLWRRSLWFVVVIHAVIDLPILFLPFIAPYLANS